MIQLMKKIIKFLATMFLVTILSTCSKSPLCWGDDKNRGIIVSEVKIDQLWCIDPFMLPEQQYVIDDNETYYNLITDTVDCDSSDLPEIDFINYTLLGQYATGGCEVKFIRKVSDNEKDREYLYSITVRECGLCNKERFDMNWVLVPKLPDNYTVEFSIKE